MLTEERLLMIKLINERIQDRRAADKPNKIFWMRDRLSKIDNAEFDDKLNEEPIKRNPHHWTDN